MLVCGFVDNLLMKYGSYFLKKITQKRWLTEIRWKIHSKEKCRVDKNSVYKKNTVRISYFNFWLWKKKRKTSVKTLFFFCHASSSFAHAFHWVNWTNSGYFASKNAIKDQYLPTYLHFLAIYQPFFAILGSRKTLWKADTGRT